MKIRQFEPPVRVAVFKCLQKLIQATVCIDLNHLPILLKFGHSKNRASLDKKIFILKSSG
jgi:hypothetical protein